MAEGVKPPPAKFSLPLFKSLTSVQLVPFHNSVTALFAPPGFSPPKANAAVFVPAPTN